MRCTQCNAEFEGQLQHCPSCLTASSNELVQACINCKHELQPSFKLCPQCGEPTQQESTFVITCPNIKDEKICGRPLKPSMKFCGGCRWKINTLIFIPGNKVCGTHTENEAVCINIIETDEDFCTECGTEVKRGMDTDDVEMEDISVEVETNLATKQRDHLVAAESGQKNNIIINKDVNMQEDESTGEQVQNTKINDDPSTLLGNTVVTNVQLEDGKKIEITNNPGQVDGTSTHISQIRLQKPFQDQTEDIQINMEISRSSLDIAGSVDPAGDGNGNVNSSCLLETNSKDNTSSSDKSSDSRTEDGSTDKALQPKLSANRAYVLQANESDTKYTVESDSESDQTHPSSTADPTASELSAPESKKNRGIQKKEKEQYERQKEREYEKEKNKQKDILKEIDAEPFLKTTENTIHSNSATSDEENGTISNRETEDQGINPGSKADGKKIQEVKDESEDTEKMDRQRGSDSNESEEKHENKAVAGRSHRSQETVEVNFHAIASKLFMPKPERSNIYIRIHNEQFGNGDLRYPMEMKRIKMSHHCCVPHCTSNSSKTDQELSFHTFPRDPVISKKWIVAIRRDVGTDFRINKETRVCSLHFDKTDYYPTTELHVRRRLRGGACPSIFYWTKQTSARRTLCRVVPKKTKVVTTSLKVEAVNATSRSFECEPVSPVDERPESTSDDSLTELEDAMSPTKAELKQNNLTLLHLRSKEKFSILRFCNSDADIKFYTGFSSFSGLHSFFTFLQPACNFLYYVGTENTSQGTPYAVINKRGRTRSLSPMEELFITLVRLRKDFPEKLIGDLYNISEGHISKILNTWILFLSDRLSSLPIWPKRDHVQKTMPRIFRQYYPTTRVIVDCTEIFIGHPSASECQRETFSTYKHHNTAKGLIGISPSGQISFISPLYAGRCSDKKIIRHCGILDLIEEGDGMMADRGFDISPDLESRGATLIMPAFLSGQDQFTTTQLVDSRNIATVRVHVERAVRKVKEFEILRSVPITLCPMLEKIWIVCGHLANFTGTLINNPN